MFPFFNSYIDTMRLGWAVAQLGQEAHTVVTLRLLGIAGAWPMPPGETGRMLAEKPPAWADAWTGAAMATVRGASSAAVMGAAVRPLYRVTHANHRRLGRKSRPHLPLPFS